MGTNELEPRGAGGFWPLAEQGRAGVALHPLQDQAGYGVRPQSDFNLAALYHIVWAWRWLILGAVAAGIAGGVIVTLLTTPIYRSSVVLELNPPVVEVMEKEGAGQLSQGDRFFLATQYGLLESRALAERVAQDLNLGSNTALVPEEMSREARQNAVVSMLAAGVEVEPTPESRLVQVHFSSPDPQLAARVVNGYAESFINSSLERRYQSSSYARDFLQRQIGIVRQELENSERQLVAYAQQQGIISSGGANGQGDGGGPTGESLSAINRALSEATARRIAAEQRYRQALTTRPTAEVGERTAALRSQLAALQAEYQDKSQVFQPDYPEMVRIRTRIQSIEQSIQGEESNVRAGRAGTLQADYQAAVAEERGLQSRVAELRGAVLNLRGRSIQYNIFQRDVDTNRALYDALLQRYKEIGVAGGIGQSQASIVDRGQVPSAPYKPNLLLNLLVGLALGLISGIGLALLLEFLNDTIKTPDDVREKLRLAFLGGIPASKNHAVQDLNDTSAPISEAYFSAMTSLQFTTENGAPKVLLVTSTRPAEGKSTTAWALASSFARRGQKVLLIDADMRKPAFVTGGEKVDGLANMLTNRDPLSSHVVKPELEGVWLLPCGPLPPNPAELLSSPRLAAILAEASAQYDLVIVDSPPILGLADTPLLSSVAAGTLVVIEAGRTRTRAASEALGRLRQAGANIVGAVLTRYKHDAVGYGYSYDAYRYNSIEKRDREIRLIVSENA
jgi:capsular exopolysaccharide synthesis family protein